jgi:hypothetical protein
MESTSDAQATPATQVVTAQVTPQNWLDKLLGLVPRALSSHAHIIFLAALGVYLVILPLAGVNVSAETELIGGNYTNVTSDLGACIAAGLTVHLVKRERRRGDQIEDLLRRLHARHEALQERIDTAIAAAKRAEDAARSGRGPVS